MSATAESPATTPAPDSGAGPSDSRDRASLSIVVFRGVFVACLLVVGLWEAGYVYREANSHREALLEAGDLLARRLANTLVNPLWNFDHDEVHRAVHYEASSPGVLAILVEDDKCRLLVGLSRQAPGELVAYDPGKDGGRSLQGSVGASRQPIAKADSIDKSIRVAVDGPSEPAVALADPVQLEQAILNLCVNAAHAMTFMRPPGEPWGGTLTLALRRVHPDAAFREQHPEAEARGYWELAVHDTGVGMDRATRARLFTPFFTTKATGQGTGLGLSMVYSIVKGAGGFVSVSSEPGAGTTFTLFLPEVAAETSRPGGTAAGGVVHRGTGTVLVVDDEEPVRSLAAKILEECGYTVLTASDGAEGVKLFGALAGGVDLVLLDLMMPVLSGREAYLRMRALQPAVRVLLSSGFRHDARVNELLDAGVHGFVEKPYTFQSLSRAVGEALGAAATTRSA